MIDPAFVNAALAGAWLRGSHLHGEEHWRCVAASGLWLAGQDAGADPTVVFCFGLLHDARRENESYDPQHGVRAVAYARELAAAASLPLTREQLDLLCHAMELHSDGLVSDDATVAACWDADRLHLPRVGDRPTTGSLLDIARPRAWTAGCSRATSRRTTCLAGAPRDRLSGQRVGRLRR